MELADVLTTNKSLVKVARLYRSAQADTLSRLALHPGQDVLLWILGEEPDGITVSEIAARKLPVLVAAPRDPTSGLAVSYRLSAARAAGGGVPITADGFEGYLAVAARLAGERVPRATPGVFSMSRVSILPADLERGHESESGWARGVALVKVVR